jgi:hypothetical protein
VGAWRERGGVLTSVDRTGGRYQYPWRDGEPGQCVKMGKVLHAAGTAPKYGALDYLKMDLRNMCRARGWRWRGGRCGPR